jgi:hypothetical protein
VVFQTYAFGLRHSEQAAPGKVNMAAAGKTCVRCVWRE